LYNNTTIKQTEKAKAMKYSIIAM